MARPIEEKIVKMSLDNSDFQKKAEETTGIFGKLNNFFSKFKGSKELDNTTSSMKGLNNEVKNNQLGQLAEAVQNVAGKFNAMGVVAATVISNITTRAIDMGVQLVKSLSLDGIKGGFDEYENKMKSIQVIMSNTQGSASMDDIKASLADLNTYADQTIYSFEQMTSNIGTFTAAGVDLGTAQKSIKGIANLAATSGSNSQQAATAMYQLSQAIAAGKVGLQDWNSVVNAGMGGKLFQNALKQTAKEMGRNVDESVSFRDSLQDGWISAEVLTNTLSKFAEDQSMLEAATKVRTFTQLIDTLKEAMGSGWATTWELFIGDFEEAGEMWTQVNDVLSGMVGSSSDARNALVKTFVELGGRQDIINTISNAFNTLIQVMNIVKGAWQTFFPPKTAEDFKNITARIAELSAQFRAFIDGNADKISNIFKGVFSVLDSGLFIIKNVASAFSTILPGGLGQKFIDMGSDLGVLLQSFNTWLKTSPEVQKFFEDMALFLQRIRDRIVEVLPSMDQMRDGWQKFAGYLKLAVDAIKDFLPSWDEFGDVVQTVVDVILGAVGFIAGGLKSISNAVKAFWDFISPYLKKLKDGVVDVFGDWTTQDIANIGFVGVLALIVKSIMNVTSNLDGIFGKIKDLFEGLQDSLSVFDKLKESLSALTGAVKASTLLIIAGSIVLIAGALKLMASIDADDMTKSLASLAAILAMLSTTLTAISKSKLGLSTGLSAAGMIVALAGSILVIAAALKILATIDSKDMVKGMLALTVIIAEMTLMLGALSLIEGKLGASSLQMLALATAMVIMAQAVKTLSKIDEEGLKRGVVALGVIMAELAVFMKIVNGSKIGVGSAIAVAGVAGAILIMIEGIKQLGEMDVEVLKQGMASIGIILLALAGFTKVVNGAKLVSTAAGIFVIAKSMQELVKPIQELGQTDPETLGAGLVTLGLALAGIVLAMQGAKGGLVGAGAIAIMAGAINLLVPPLKALGNMSLGQIAKALIALGGAFAIVAVGANAIGIVGAVGLLAFSAALVAISVAALAVAVAFTAFSAALTLLAGMGVTQIRAITDNLGHLLDGIIDLIPKIIELAVTIIVEFVNGLKEAVPEIAEAGLTIVEELLTSMSEHAPEIVRVASDLIINLIDALAEKLPELITAGIEFIIDFIDGMANGIRENSQPFVDAVLNLIESLLELVIDALGGVLKVLLGWIPGMEDAIDDVTGAAKSKLREGFGVDELYEIGREGGAGFVDGIAINNDDAQYTAEQLAESSVTAIEGVDFVEIGTTKGTEYVDAFGVTADDAEAAGVAEGEASRDGAASVDHTGAGEKNGQDYTDALQGMADGANTAGKNVGDAGNMGMSNVPYQDTGTTAGTKYANGVSGQTKTAELAGTTLANAGKGGAESVSYTGSGENAGSGFAQGLFNMVDKVKNAAANLVQNALDQANKTQDARSPSRKTMKSGGYFGQGLVNGMLAMVKSVGDAGRTLVQAGLGEVNTMADGIKNAMMADFDVTPTIRPVVDLSNVDYSQLNGRFAIGLDAKNLAKSTQTQSGGNGDINIGDINIDIDSPDAQTAEQTMNTIQSEIGRALTTEIRKLKKVY